MKIVIFAGGSGRRLWPISRQKTPKQFEPIVGDRSTLQMAVDRVRDVYGIENVFVSTGERYVDILSAQLPDMPKQNLIGEPTRRDLAAAVGLAMSHIARVAEPNEPVAILWGDNTMQDVGVFQDVLAAAEQLVLNNEAKIAFIGETPRFANDQLGWIGMGEQFGEIGKRPYYGFRSLTYRPAFADCQKMFANETHCWNTGYFVTTPAYIQSAYQEHQPNMYGQLQEIQDAIGAENYQETLHRVYPEIDSMSFDDAILVHLDPSHGRVLHGEMGWSDPGTLYALKEAVAPAEGANAEKGLVRALETSDSLLYNYDKDKLLVGVGLEGMIVVNTEDAILVVPKDKIPLVKTFVNGLIGTDLEKYS
jgi:mannose-1-phosphate guanylyltransferase